MAYGLRPGQGSLFRNERKQSDRHPDYNGSINIDGTEFWLSGWLKDGKKGKFLSIALGKPKDQQPGQPQDSGAHNSDLDEEVPF